MMMTWKIERQKQKDDEKDRKINNEEKTINCLSTEQYI